MGLGELFTTTLREAVAGIALFDYGKKEDFETLWGTKDINGSPALLDSIKDNREIVVVWDGRDVGGDPSGNLLKPHLTPLDWALAFSLAVLAKSEADAFDSIHIVDLTGKVHEEWAMRMRHQLLAEMPWVTLHAPLIPEGMVVRQGYQPIISEDGQDGLLKPVDGGSWCLLPSRKKLAKCQERAGDLSKTAKQWAASLTQSRDHHDVNNIIGPEILSRGAKCQDTLRSAFLNRLDWCDLDLRQAGIWDSWDPRPAVEKLFNRTLTVLTVDDQLDQGWDRFACRLFGNRKFDKRARLSEGRFTRIETNYDRLNVAVLGCLSATPLIKFLETAHFNSRNYAQQIPIDNNPVLQPQLILLDLRLYSQSQNAREQAAKLLRIARTRAQGALAWLHFDDGELDRIDTWCNRGVGETRVTDEALLLLPRLLSLALPLTPIILFSSTGQAWIRERLKPYENIFTGFEKPRILSDPASVKASIAALREGLDNAIPAMRLRLQLAHAQRAVRQASDARGKLAARLTSQHVEIYGDETRSLEEGITSGLAVCVYPSIYEAKALQAKLIVEHANAGVVWARTRTGGVPQLKKGSEISKDTVECATQVELLANLLRHRDVAMGDNERQLWSVVATRVPAAIPEQGSVSLAAFPDGPLDDALRFNLEFALYVLIPYFCADDFDGTVHLYLPSRVVVYDLRRFAIELCEAFDLGAPIQADSASWLVPTAAISSDGMLGTAFPLVRGWLHEWQSRIPLAAQHVTKIKMATLGRGTRGGIDSTEAGKRRLFHDIADWACTASGKLHDISNDKWIWPLHEQLNEKKLFPYWFLSTDTNKNGKARKYWFETDSANASTLMAALKVSFLGSFNFRGSFDEPSESDALRLLLRNTYIETCDDRLLNNDFCAQQRLILWNIRYEFEHASGRILHSLFTSDRGISRQPDTQHHNAKPESAAVKVVADERPVAGVLEDKDESDVRSNEIENASVGTLGREPIDLPVEDSQESPDPTVNEPLPDILVDEDLTIRFTGCGFYNVLSATKFGDIFFKASSDPGSEGTHWKYDRKLAFQLRNEGWTQPLVVYAMELPVNQMVDQAVSIDTAATARKEKPLTVVAVKMADGRWKATMGS